MLITIASLGQTSWQVPQSMQYDDRCGRLLPSVISKHLTGQAPTHSAHPVHFSQSTKAMNIRVHLTGTIYALSNSHVRRTLTLESTGVKRAEI